MYEELYRAWRAEKTADELQPIASGFYREASRYIGDLKERLKIGGERGIASSLLRDELRISSELLSDLMNTRLSKLLRLVEMEKEPPAETLAEEERQFLMAIETPLKDYRQAMAALLEGRWKEVGRPTPSRILLRFTAEVPAIIGINLETYGPFKPEDVATLPAENALLLVQQGFAKRIDVKAEKRLSEERAGL